MLRSTAAVPLAALLLVSGVVCYQDDTTAPNGGGKPVVQVLLTDAPFPYADVASVEVHVVRIDAAAIADSSNPSQAWVTITTPDSVFDLLELQQGQSALVGEGTLNAGQYEAVRMTINTARSAIRFADGSPATVRWPGDSGAELTLLTIVQGSLVVADSGTAIVIDFDVGRSFLYDAATRVFDFIPYLRAVNRAATGSIAGVVTRDDGGTPQPVAYATITVFSGNPSFPATWYVASSGHTDAAGAYRIGYLLAGSYIVSIEHPGLSALGASVVAGVAVQVGGETPHSVTLHAVGGAGITIQGALTIDVGQSTQLQAVVTDEQGQPVPSPAVTWSSLNQYVATVSGTGEFATVTGMAPGLATIVGATSGLVGSVDVRVRGDSTAGGS